MEKKITEYRLGRSIAQLVQFYRKQQKEQKEHPIISKKLVITMLIVALVKIAILIMYT